MMFGNGIGLNNQRCWACGNPATGWYQPVQDPTACAPTNPGPFPECYACNLKRLGGVPRSDYDALQARVTDLEAQVKKLTGAAR